MDRDNIVSRLWAQIDDIHMSIVELREELAETENDYLKRKEAIEFRIAELYKESFDAYGEILNYRASQSEPEKVDNPHDILYKNRRAVWRFNG